MQTFTASDGLDIAYALDDYTDPWEAADTLILIHAAMGSSKRFYAWVPHLARDLRVVRIDLRGHGRSGIPAPEQLSPQRLVQDIVERADHVGAARFHVAGSSAGAMSRWVGPSPAASRAARSRSRRSAASCITLSQSITWSMG